MKILVVDDDAVALLVLQAAVQSLGHECETALDGVTAWTAFQQRPPAVLISDLRMPGLAGLELCRRVRAHDTETYTYLILVTSHGGPDQVLKGMGAGADDYLIKPLNPSDLGARLVAAARVTALHGSLAGQRSELEAANRELAAVSRQDPLTGLGNRRALDEDLDQLEARVGRYGHVYSMALFDIDHFKSYNDTYGHQAGDEALRRVAAQLSGDARGGDVVYRYGGEEFLCIFPEQSRATGRVAVERMRCGVEALAIPHAGHPLGILTVSAGLAVLDPLSRRSAAAVLKEADEALYVAKQRGRNRVALSAEREREATPPQGQGKPARGARDPRRSRLSRTGR
jgi:two-component system chemotaxis response regulator CheY